MKNNLIGLESSSIMPLITITPLTQECYESIWGEYSTQTLIAHEDSIAELKNVFNFKTNTFYSNPITRLKKVKEFPLSKKLSLKGAAFKLLLDGQMGGWVGNKNSRVQAFFFSDVIDAIDDNIKDAETFSEQLILKMRTKIQTYNQMLTPDDGVLSIDIKQILPYWGFHNIDSAIFTEKRGLQIKILPNCESITMFESLPAATRRDAYHYHMLKKEKVRLILVGDANYKNNICSCPNCLSYDCSVMILTDAKRKKLLKLS
jgi:hypothetical protein